MSRFIRSILPYVASSRGFTVLELVISVGIMGIAMAATSGLFLAGRNFMRDQTLEVETTQAARATIDLLLRELRLGGACLPVTGDFISLDGANSGTLDSVVSRTGLVRPDLSCIRTTATVALAIGETNIPLQNADGFSAGRRGYIRSGAGVGEFFDIVFVNPGTNALTITPALASNYPVDAGVYEVDERSFSINNTDPLHPVLEMRVDGKAPSKLATGIEKLNIQYQLRRNCPTCDVVDLPGTEPEWAIVEEYSSRSRHAQTGLVRQVTTTGARFGLG